MRCAIEEVRHRGKGLEEILKERTSELHHLENELELLKAAAGMALDEDHPSDFYIETLNGNLIVKEKSLVELELQGYGVVISFASHFIISVSDTIPMVFSLLLAFSI